MMKKSRSLKQARMERSLKLNERTLSLRLKMPILGPRCKNQLLLRRTILIESLVLLTKLVELRTEQPRLRRILLINVQLFEKLRKEIELLSGSPRSDEKSYLSLRKDLPGKYSQN